MTKDGELAEDNMDLMRKAAKGAMQTLKMKDGKLKMDSFTASGIMQVYDGVNPKNKIAMEKMINTGLKGHIAKLQSLAMKASKGARRREEVEIDEVLKPEAKVKVPHKGKLRDGKVVRYVPQRGAASPYYVVDVGEYQSIEVPAHKIDEGRMSDLHLLIKQGKSAEQIAKLMKLDVESIESWL